MKPADHRELGEFDRGDVPFSESLTGSYLTSSRSLFAVVNGFLKMFILGLWTDTEIEAGE